MNQEIVQVGERGSKRVEFSQLILSVRRILPSVDGMHCEVVIGYPGLSNVVKSALLIGDAVLYETPGDGILEVRLMRLTSTSADFLVSEVSPRGGFAAGLVSGDPSNLPFSESELTRVAQSIAAVKATLSRSEALSKEQFDLVERKLDEIKSGSERFGRKDWINWAAGTLSGLFSAAAFAPEVTRKIVEAMNSAFAWLFTGAIALLR